MWASRSDAHSGGFRGERIHDSRSHRLESKMTPRRLTPSCGLPACFGANGDVFFVAEESGADFVYRIKEDGGELQQARGRRNAAISSPLRTSRTSPATTG